MLTTACQHIKKIARNQNIPLSQLPIEQVASGMTKNEVLMLLGPAHINPKQPDRWSYLYIVRGKVQDNIFIVEFENDRVVSFMTQTKS